LGSRLLGLRNRRGGCAWFLFKRLFGEFNWWIRRLPTGFSLSLFGTFFVFLIWLGLRLGLALQPFAAKPAFDGFLPYLLAAKWATFESAGGSHTAIVVLAISVASANSNPFHCQDYGFFREVGVSC